MMESDFEDYHCLVGKIVREKSGMYWTLVDNFQDLRRNEWAAGEDDSYEKG